MTCAPPRRRVRSGERGSALVEFTWIGLLLLLPLVYVIVTVFTVQRSAYGATEAARSAGRAFILVARRRDRTPAGVRRGPSVDERPRCRHLAEQRRHRLQADASVVPAAGLVDRGARSTSTYDCRWCPTCSVNGPHRSRSMRRTPRRTASIARRPSEGGAPRRRSEAGQLTVLICVFALCLLLVIAAVTDLSASHLRKRAVTSLADGAALSASDAAAAGSVYGGADDEYVALAEPAARAAVETLSALRSARTATIPDSSSTSRSSTSR